MVLLSNEASLGFNRQIIYHIMDHSYLTVCLEKGSIISDFLSHPTGLSWLPGKYNKETVNQIARDFFRFYFSSFFL